MSQFNHLVSFLTVSSNNLKKDLGFIFIITIIFVTIFGTSQFAQAQAPALPMAVEVAPFYWSEDGFGIDVLKGFGFPLQ